MTSETKTSVNSLFDTGSVIDGKWVLIERIGKGGMGEVFRAHQLNLKRDLMPQLQDICMFHINITNDMQKCMVFLIAIQTKAEEVYPNSSKDAVKNRP